MKNIIERYIYAVTKRLPEAMKEEVKEELNSNIHDMLSKNPTDEEIDRILHELGHPRELAKNYRGQDRYVISPVFYDDYIQVLKIVSIIFLAITLVFGTFDAIIHVEATSTLGGIAEVFGKVISNAFGAFATAFFWVTIIFWGIDYQMKNKKLPEWKLSELPELPSPTTTKISRVESIVGLILGTAFSAVFIIFLLRYVHLFGIYENGVMVAQIFNKEVTDPFIMYFVISALIGLIVSLLKINYGEWRINLAIVYSAHQILSTALFLIFIRSTHLIQDAVFVKVASYLDMTVLTVEEHFSKALLGVTVVFSILVTIDVIMTWFKTLRGKKK